MNIRTCYFVIFLIMSVLSSCDQGNKNNPSEKTYPYTNALVHCSSPYLLEHAHNPVNWYPWGEEALQKAKAENKPLIISIGYSACHWCHVMEHECYSDTEVADYMNAHFVSIKVDREERPDIDQIYMDASQLLTGSGGWPLNAFALPDGRPFYAVTYLPKAGWLDLLHQIVKIYQEEPGKVTEQADALTKGIQGQALVKQPVDTDAEKLTAVYRSLFDSVKSSIDFQYGGFGRAPKFPMPNAWELLLQFHYLTGNEKSLEAVTTTLDHMARGGIYDQLGGGFARYATDLHWRVPHFEKMLYDNAQLVSLYAHAYEITHSPLYGDVIRETLGFIAREMTDPKGGFYSSINADSQGEEGKFYVWTAAEIDSLLDDKTARLIKDYYQVTPAGNWEERKSILYHEQTDTAFAKTHDMTVEGLQAALQKGKDVLFRARAKRVRPTTDNKILTSWNALMLKGYVDAYRALGDEQYLAAALKDARFLEENMMTKDGRLWRNYMDGKADIPGMLDDYASLADAFVALYQVTFDAHWLSVARQLTSYAIAHFRDPETGLFFYTSDQSGHLVARKKEIEDNVLPSSNSVMANVLYRLGIYDDNASFVQISTEMLAQTIRAIPSAVPYFANWAGLLGLMQWGPDEVAVMGADALEKTSEMQKHYLPMALFMGGNEENLPLLKDKLVQGQTTIYVCEDKVCKRPVTKVKEALEQLK